MSEKLQEAIIEILLDYANAEESAAVNLKHRIAEAFGPKEVAAVKEETFSVLSYEKQHGNKIGEFEVASKANNIAEKFERAHNVLQKNNATISSRYHGEGYGFSYWLYAEKIYRQPFKAK